MPWCEPCGAFYNPNTLHPDGTCPRCGDQVAEPEEAARSAASTTAEGPETIDDDELVARVPWHFWVGVIAMVIYLGWRMIQGVAWFF